MTTPSILIVEDDQQICQIYQQILNRLACRILIAGNAEAGLHLAVEKEPDLIILDCLLPNMSGIVFCREVRQTPAIAATPILMVTGVDDTEYRIDGLRAGADDYLAKPVMLKELIARVCVLLQRRSSALARADTTPLLASRQDPPEVHITVDVPTHCARFGKQEFYLTEREALLLHYLICHTGQVCLREQLLRDVWGYSPDAASSSLVRYHISNLRKKIVLPSDTRPIIQTVRSRGYLFSQPLPVVGSAAGMTIAQDAGEKRAIERGNRG
jgi:DNA-binding response OmpR family regulator